MYLGSQNELAMFKGRLYYYLSLPEYLRVRTRIVHKYWPKNDSTLFCHIGGKKLRTAECIRVYAYAISLFVILFSVFQTCVSQKIFEHFLKHVLNRSYLFPQGWNELQNIASIILEVKLLYWDIYRYRNNSWQRASKHRHRGKLRV